jgi:hypothetical protein
MSDKGERALSLLAEEQRIADMIREHHAAYDVMPEGADIVIGVQRCGCYYDPIHGENEPCSVLGNLYEDSHVAEARRRELLGEA